jgi:hypothetical protein
MELCLRFYLFFFSYRYVSSLLRKLADTAFDVSSGVVRRFAQGSQN